MNSWPMSGQLGTSFLELESCPEGLRNWIWWLAISSKHMCNDQTCLSISPDLFLRFPPNPEVPDSLVMNSLLLKFINLQSNSSNWESHRQTSGEKNGIMRKMMTGIWKKADPGLNCNFIIHQLVPLGKLIFLLACQHHCKIRVVNPETLILQLGYRLESPREI